MDINKILNSCDHTALSVTATENDIRTLIGEAEKYKTASVCIPPCFVKLAKSVSSPDLKICTVIGFPNGYSTTESKIYETKDAIENGADEIDIVINLCKLKDGKYTEIEDEIKRIKEVCGKRILKVIIETCLLNEEEKIEMCRVISNSGADYIKTSTGFSTHGATVEDVKLFSEHISSHVKIKAAGGISTLEDAETFLNLGASRLGTSKIVKLIKNSDTEEL